MTESTREEHLLEHWVLLKQQGIKSFCVLNGLKTLKEVFLIYLTEIVLIIGIQVVLFKIAHVIYELFLYTLSFQRYHSFAR